MYATDGWTDGRTDKSNAYCPLPYGRRAIICVSAQLRHAVTDYQLTAGCLCLLRPVYSDTTQLNSTQLD